MPLFRVFTVLLMTFMLSACSAWFSHSEIDALNEIEPVGDAFTQRLAHEYRDFANFEQDEMFDYADALHFARKGLMAAEGQVVLPEPLENWRIHEDIAPEFVTQQERLLIALDNGGRELAPNEAAFAQFSYDCWIEQKEENWQADDIAACRDQYYAAIADLEVALAETMPAPVEEAQVVTVQPAAEVDESTTGIIPIEEAMFLVFFDFDKSAVDTSGQDVIQSVAAKIVARTDIKSVVVTGHTDSSGSNAYNQRLSLKRANAVKEALVEQGVADALIRVDALGEKDQLVATPNNTREPANRRAEIRFE